MIPKKIHYTWFSGDPYPQMIQDCIESWHKTMPDYEYVLWDFNRIKDIDSVWLKECLSQKKWAFAADFIRLYALYYEGGIYLDTDVEVYKPLDEFLEHRVFIGREGAHYILLEKEVNVFLTSHCMGAEAGHPFIKDCLDYYSGRHFIRCNIESVPKNLRLDMLMMPYIQSEIAKKYGYNPSLNEDRLQTLKEDVIVYPSPIFGALSKNKKTYICHLANGSWREEKWVDTINYSLGYKIKWRIKALINKIARFYGYLLIKIK